MKSIKNKLKYIYVLASSEFSHVIADNLKCLPGLESVSPLCQPHPDSSVDLNISVCPLKNSSMTLMKKHLYPDTHYSLIIYMYILISAYMSCTCMIEYLCMVFAN